MRTLIASVAMLVSTWAMAADSPMHDTDKCGDKLNQGEMNACYADEFRRADGELNVSYSKLISRLHDNKSAVALLRQSERAWLTYREKYCDFEGEGSEGGSVQPTVVSICLISITRARIAELEFQLHCPEGDLACP